MTTQLRTNAPHVLVVVVMPGHVGTNIVANSARALGRDPARDVIAGANEGYPDAAPTSAAEAATVSVDAVKSGAWRVLVGGSALELDAFVRAHPEAAYDHAKRGEHMSP